MRFMLILVFFVSLFHNTMAQMKTLYVGTFTERGSQGIYVYQFNNETGALELLQTQGGMDSPSFLTLHPSKKYLYSANRSSVVEGQDWGSVTAFKVAQDGGLSMLNEQSSYGAGACHLAVDQSGKQLYVANYGQGNFTGFPIDEAGRLGAFNYTFQNEGIGPVADRQNGPHLHQVVFSPDNRYVFITDLGTDEILAFRFKGNQGKTLFKEKKGGKVDPGSGPRHIAFHPNGKWVFCASELSSTVSSFRYRKGSGKWKKVDRQSSLPADYQDDSFIADIHVHPNGSFLYVSNRGLNSIAIFKIDQKTGKLTLIGQESTKGNWPRNFILSPDGNWLLVANRRSDQIVVFKVNPDTGLLVDANLDEKVPAPVCLIWK